MSHHVRVPTTPTTPLLPRASSRHNSILSKSIPGPLTRPLSTTARRFLANIPIILSIFLAVFFVVHWSELLFDEPIPTGPPWRGPPFLLPVNIAELLGPYSPYFPAAVFEKLGGGCNVTQVHFLQRHGARFPTKSQDEKIRRALSHIKPPPRDKHNTSLAFMRKYKYDLETDDLLYFGATEAWSSGVLAYNRYSDLARAAPPFLRAANSSRVVNTAKYWKKGFELAGRMKLTKPFLLSEETGTNNTLKNNQCPNHSNAIAEHAQATYLQLFAPSIVSRLNGDAPGSTLENEDIPALMGLCSFESLSKYKTSPWCGVFNAGNWDGDVGNGSGGEWEGYEYYMDLEKFYNTGPGNPLGRPQGIGYINELIARLTHSQVNDTTQTNRTLDHNNATFPLNRTMYADFTHDNEMTAIIAAMGVLREPGAMDSEDDTSTSKFDGEIETELDTDSEGQIPLRNQRRDRVATWTKEMDPREPNPHRKWIASKIVPFASRMVVEKLLCPSSIYGSQDALLGRTIYVDAVRVLLNDQVLNIPGCDSGLGNGICTLEEFLTSQNYSRNQGEGEWDLCFEQGVMGRS